MDLLAAALAAQLHDEPRGSGPEALLADVYAYVDEHLGEPDLSPARIAAAQHVSLRRLHTLFEGQDTTVSAWIRQRRLDRCRRDLLDPAQRSRPAHAIAARWGLPNAAHFTRLFKATYGLPPARYRTLTDR